MSVRWFSRLLGRPLPRSSAGDERLPNIQALPILSSDALSSVAYATEAALGILILGGSAALKLSLPITIAIIALIVIVVLSYRQAIAAYPNGGGSYVVARDNLGRNVGLVAAAALLIDYTLTAAVSLMAGTQALSSLDPTLLPYEVPIALVLLVLVGWANLRGGEGSGASVRDSHLRLRADDRAAHGGGTAGSDLPSRLASRSTAIDGGLGADRVVPDPAGVQFRLLSDDGH